MIGNRREVCAVLSDSLTLEVANVPQLHIVVKCGKNREQAQNLVHSWSGKR